MKKRSCQQQQLGINAWSHYNRPTWIGWPDIWDELSLFDGLILKVTRMGIPQMLRGQMPDKGHSYFKKAGVGLLLYCFDLNDYRDNIGLRSACLNCHLTHWKHIKCPFGPMKGWHRPILSQPTWLPLVTKVTLKMSTFWRDRPLEIWLNPFLQQKGCPMKSLVIIMFCEQRLREVVHCTHLTLSTQHQVCCTTSQTSWLRKLSEQSNTSPWKPRSKLRFVDLLCCTLSVWIITSFSY